MAAAIVALLSACGGRVSVGSGPGAQPPVLPPAAAPFIDDCAPPLLVPRGVAWVGGLHWHGGKLEPNECDPLAVLGAFVGIKLFVPDLFLDQDQVTNACYRHCVDAGVCDPPHPVPVAPDAPPWPPWDDASMRQVPTQWLDDAMAEAFCAWRGGRLPSLAELMRAEHGQAVAVVNQALTELWLACANEPRPEECDEIWTRVDSWPSPVRSWDLDRGPFGHYDLAASPLELTMTRLPASLDDEHALCAIPPGSIDPRSLGSGNRAGFETAGNLLHPPVEGAGVAWAVWGAMDEGGHPVPLEGGARCAYDPL